MSHSHAVLESATMNSLSVSPKMGEPLSLPVADYRRIRRPLLLLIVLSLLGLFTGGRVQAEEMGPTTTVIGQNITTNTVWTKTGSPYQLSQTISVKPGATLTIEPGVEVIAAGQFFLIIEGGLVAEGTGDAPILFTSTNKQPGAWYGLKIGYNSQQPATARLHHAIVEYALPSNLPNDGSLTAREAILDIRNSTFRHSGGNGIAVSGPVTMTISDSRFENNGLAALFIYANPRQPHLSNLTASGNGSNTVVYYATSLENALTLQKVGLPYEFKGGMDVEANGSLTLTPGVEVRVDTGFFVRGRIDAIGTAAEPILITGIKQTPGGWWGLSVSGNEQVAHATLDHVILDYGGRADSDYSANLVVSSAAVTVTNSILRNGGKHGVADHGGAPDEGHTLSISDSALLNNGGAALVTDDESANPTLQNLTVSGNGVNAIEQRTISLTGNHLWENVGVPYLVLKTIAINQGALVIEPGVEVRFGPEGGIGVYSGALQAAGLPSLPITFTGVTQEPGAWGHLTLAPNGGVMSLRYCDIGYGGGDGQAGMVETGSNTLFVSECHLHHSATAGIHVFATDKTPIIFGNRIEHNAQGIVNIGQGEVDARLNWWGDQTGPFHASNPSGKGNPVSDRVQFQPWLQSPDQSTDGGGLEVRISGPGEFTPGATVRYAVFYNNLSKQAITNVILRVLLPQAGEMLRATGNGIYWAQRNELFWKLGTVPAGASGIFIVEIRYPWGMPFDSNSVLLAQAAGDGVTPVLFESAPYFAFSPPVLTGESTLSAEQVQAERATHAAVEQHYNKATTAGYRQGIALRRTFADGTEETVITLLKGQPRVSAYIIVRQNGGVYALIIDGSSLTALRGNDGLRFSEATGDWAPLPAIATVHAADDEPAPVAFEDCMEQCFIEKVPAHLIKKAIAALDVADAVLDCLGIKTDSGAGDYLGCSQTIIRKLPLYGEGVEIVKCTEDCTACVEEGGGCTNDKCHCCTEDKYYCSSETWPYNYFGRETLQYRQCNTETGRYKWEKTQNVCQKCEKCDASNPNSPCRLIEDGFSTAYMAADDRLALVAVASGGHCDKCAPAKDPNELYGPDGDLLPGQRVAYTITYENVGAGPAFGVYVTDKLGEHFDLATLAIGGNGKLLPGSRTLVWDVGELAPKGQPGATGLITFSVQLALGLARDKVITNGAVVYFPSVPEETPTNVLLHQVQPLIANGQALQTVAGQPLAITLSGREASNLPLTYALVEAPSYGKLSGVAPTLVYTPPPDFSGLDQLRFTVSNGSSQSAPAAITIRVLPSPDDKAAPRVLWNAPANGERIGVESVLPLGDSTTGAAYLPVIQIKFSEAMNEATINATNLVVMKNGAPIPVTVRYDATNNQALLLLGEVPVMGVQYTVAVNGAVTDLMGNAMGAVHQFAFQVDTTGSTTDARQLFLPMIRR